MIDDGELIGIFYEEAHSLIGKMTGDISFLSGRQRPSEEALTSIYKRLYRYAHTLKGSAGIVGLTQLEGLAAVLEKIFRSAKEGQTEIENADIPLLSESVQACEKRLRGVDSADFQRLLTRLKTILSR